MNQWIQLFVRKEGSSKQYIQMGAAGKVHYSEKSRWSTLSVETVSLRYQTHRASDAMQVPSHDYFSDYYYSQSVSFNF